MTTQEILAAAKSAKFYLAALPESDKDKALYAMADALEAECSSILEANARDAEAVRGTVSDVMLDRLMLSKERIEGMAQGIREVAELPDPVGRILTERTTSDGLLLKKVSVPIGVIAIIYESRPNVTSDAAALCIKSGNKERQCVHSAGWQGGLPLFPRNSKCHEERAGESWLPF